MYSKKSSVAVAKNKDTWSRNLTKFQDSSKKRGKIAIEIKALDSLCKMPKEYMIIGRYLGLAEVDKSRKKRIELIGEEVQHLWNHLNFPILSSRSLVRKIETTMKRYDAYLKRPAGNIYQFFGNLFDVTNLTGHWLCTEDKKLHEVMIQSGGRVGYTTGKIASKSSIHPSKRRKVCSRDDDKPAADDDDDDGDNDGGGDDNDGDNDDDDYDDDGGGDDDDEDYEAQMFPFQTRKQRSQQSTCSAVKLVRSAKLPVRRAAKVSHILHQAGIQIPTPSQSGVYRAVYREARQLKENFKLSLNKSLWCLHFDGKIMNKKEHQVVVLKKEDREVRLAVLVLPDGKAATIADAIHNVLDEYRLWPAIKLIVSDTTNVNTGSRSGVVVRLQRKFVEHQESAPIFIGCQHHVLDRVFRHVCDQMFGDVTQSPNILYPFVTRIIEEYDMLKEELRNRENNAVDLPEEKQGWRDDMKFLHHLIRVFRHYQNFNIMPNIKFGALPGISNARWNSRAIFTLLAYILLPTEREHVEQVCRFICGAWCDAWFSDQLYCPEQYDLLHDSVLPYPKALCCLEKHWSQSPSPIPTHRSNLCAERSIKVLQDIAPLCHSVEKLCLRFLLSNDA